MLSVIAGEMTIAEAARREKVSEQSVGRWKADFLEAGKTAWAAGRCGPLTREQQLEAEVEDLEVIRIEAGMSTARFCRLIDMPERTWRHWQAKTRAGGQAKGPWPRPAPCVGS